MGIMVNSLLCVMQDSYHQPQFAFQVPWVDEAPKNCCLRKLEETTGGEFRVQRASIRLL